jgi:hypothetical protein
VSRSRNPYRRAGSWTTGTGWTSSDGDGDSGVDLDEDAPAEPWRPPLDEIRHGYTLGDVIGLANAAAANNAAYAVGDFAEFAWAAQAAIVDHLLSCEAPPTRHQLAYEGKAAVWRAIRHVRQEHGYRNRDPWEGFGSAPRFAVYWQARSDDGMAERCVERLAVAQVIAALRESDRQVLVALAAYDGDHDAAAAGTGRTVRAWRKALQVARGAAAEAWHAPETPVRDLRRLDYRRHRGEVAPCGTAAAARRHRDRRETLCPACVEAERVYDRRRKGRAG